VSPGVTKRELHLNINAFSTGVYPGSWLLPGVNPNNFFDIDYYVALAQTAERGKLDAFFLADAPALQGEISVRPPFGGGFDPLLLLSRLAASTSRLGLIATATTTYNTPFDLARKFASLDFISGGRAGWNVVTTASSQVAPNFGIEDHPAKPDRYERAGEFVDVVRGLWDSWDDDAIVADRQTRRYVRDGAVQPLNHVGKYFDVRGPLTLPRPPQGHPVVFQAGGSEGGRDLAARQADGIFSLSLEKAAAQEYAEDIRRRAAAYGRDPNSIAILPGLVTIIGGTEAEARAKELELHELAGGGPSIARLAGYLEIDPRELSLDEPVPVHLLPAEPSKVKGTVGFQSAISRIARSGLTVREILARGGGGHRLVVGTPEQIADDVAEWFLEGASDGFNLMPAALPSGLTDFVDHVVPLLQRRGVFRSEYSGTTLRDHLGLSRRPKQSLGDRGQSSFRPAAPAARVLPS
jgi:FMN-dependent oxidoreductase (nitrilotriacetate monooxygenase family)